MKLVSYSKPTEEFEKEGLVDLQELIAFCAKVSNPAAQINNETRLLITNTTGTDLSSPSIKFSNNRIFHRKKGQFFEEKILISFRLIIFGKN